MIVPPPLRTLLIVGFFSFVSISVFAAETWPSLRDFTFAKNAELPFEVQDYLRANVDRPDKYQALAEAVRAQTEKLQGDDAHVLACDILAAVGNEKDIPFLTAQLAKPVVFPSAKFALENIGTPAAVQSLLEFSTQATEAQIESLLLSFGLLNSPETIPFMVAQTKDRSMQIRRAAYQALATNLAPAVSSFLLKVTPQSSDGSGTALVEHARRVKDLNHAADLCRKVAHANELPLNLRAAAIRVMVERALPGTDAVLAEFEKSSDPAVQPLLLENFRRLSHESQQRFIRSISEQIGEPEAVRQLSAIGAAFPPGELVPLALSAHGRLREVALRLLASVGTEKEFQNALENVSKFPAGHAKYERYWNILLILPPSTEKWIKLALANQPDGVRQKTLFALIEARRIRSTETELVAALSSSDPSVRLAAAQALSVVGAPGHAARIADLLLETSDPKVRPALIRALSSSLKQSPDRQAVISRISAKLSAITEASLQEQLIALLATSGAAEAQVALWQLYDTSDLPMKKSVVRQFAQWSDSAVLPRLAEVATNGSDEALKILAVRSYLDVTGKAANLDPSTRLQHLKTAQTFINRPEEKRLIIAQAAALKIPAANTLIESYRADPALQKEVESALAPKLKPTPKTAEPKLD